MSASKDRGTRFETSLLPLLQEYWPGAERRATTGRYDKGDFALPGNDLYIVEAKNNSRLALPQFWAETQVEAVNAGVPFGVLVTKRVGKRAPEEQWAHMTLGQWLSLVHRNSRT